MDIIDGNINTEYFIMYKNTYFVLLEFSFLYIDDRYTGKKAYLYFSLRD